MPETDIILGDEDVEVRTANLSVINDDEDADSRFHADWMEPSTAVRLVSDDGDRSLNLTVGSLLWQNEENRTLEISPERVRLPNGGDGSTSVIGDIINARFELRSSDVNAGSAHFIDGTFGGNNWGTEEPTAGQVEVLDGQGDQTVLLDGDRGVVETTGGDVAEYFPNGTDEAFEGGEVVGLEDGAVTDAVADCEEAFVVASTPMLLGNRQPETDADPSSAAADHVPVALLGQVPVRVAADVATGDRLVATADGRAVPAGEGEDGAPTVGRALDSTAAGGTVTALVGYSPAARGGKDERIDAVEADDEALQAEVEALRAENETLRERLAAVEERLATVEDSGGAAPAPADD